MIVSGVIMALGFGHHGNHHACGKQVVHFQMRPHKSIRSSVCTCSIHLSIDLSVHWCIHRSVHIPVIFNRKNACFDFGRQEEGKGRGERVVRGVEGAEWAEG